MNTAKTSSVSNVPVQSHDKRS